MSPIKYDLATTVLVWCTDCTYREHAQDKPHAVLLAKAHQQRMHPDDRTMREQVGQALRRGRVRS